MHEDNYLRFQVGEFGGLKLSGNSVSKTLPWPEKNLLVPDRYS